jgi:hypothetical protein
MLGVVLVDVRGHVLGRLDGFRLDEIAEPARRPHEVLLRRGSVSYAFGRSGVRRVPRLRGGWKVLAARRPGIYVLDPRTRHAVLVHRGHGRLWCSAFAR